MGDAYNNNNEDEDIEDAEKRIWKIEPSHELRVEVELKEILKLKLVEGKAEINGTELAQGVEYQFSARKFAVFSWHGCTVEAKGVANEYVGQETPMKSILNVHFALQKLRQEAKASSISNRPPTFDGDSSVDDMKGDVGPRVMIVGPADVGKTCLAKTLASYAARSYSFPILCDIDPSGACISLPETVSAMAIHRPIDPEEEFNAGITLYKTSPIVYYYGSSDIYEKKKVYTSLLSALSQKVELKLEDPLVRSAGIIVDTPSQFIGQAGFELLVEAVAAFKINVLLVIGHERLLSDLQKKYGNDPDMSILKLSKSGGVVSRDKANRRHMQLQKVKEYFYGTTNNDMTPFSQTVSFNDVIVRRVQEGSIAPSSALPIGMVANPHEIKFVKVEAGHILLHAVLAVSYTPLPGSVDAKDSQAKPKVYTPEEEAEALLSTNLCGFVYISEVDDVKRKLTILSPNPGRLPKTFMIVGALKWLDV